MKLPSDESFCRNCLAGLSSFLETDAKRLYRDCVGDSRCPRRERRLRSSEADIRRLFAESEHETFVVVLRLVLKLHARSEWLTISQAAELAGMSVRSFQRRLAAEGLTFAQLVDQARSEVAQELLERTDRSLAEIAEDVGYSELTNFVRAFKRWTGITPDQFRQRPSAGAGED